VSERIVESGEVRLAVEEVGEGTPVLLMHGLTATRRYVVMGSRALERSDHRVLSYDARGHGASSPGPAAEDYRYDDLTADALAVLDDAGVARAVLAGASMGAHTAVRIALEHPERAAGLVLATPAYDPESHGDAVSLERWDALAAGLREDGVEGFLNAYGEPEVPERWRDTVLKVIRQRLGAHEHPSAVADALEAVPRSRPFEEIDDLHRIGVPAVVVASRDEADPGHPYAVGEAYAAALPDARLVSEDPGQSPLAWQGAQLSRIIAEVAERA